MWNQQVIYCDHFIDYSDSYLVYFFRYQFSQCLFIYSVLALPWSEQEESEALEFVGLYMRVLIHFQNFLPGKITMCITRPNTRYSPGSSFWFIPKYVFIFQSHQMGNRTSSPWYLTSTAQWQRNILCLVISFECITPVSHAYRGMYFTQMCLTWSQCYRFERDARIYQFSVLSVEPIRSWKRQHLCFFSQISSLSGGCSDFLINIFPRISWYEVLEWFRFVLATNGESNYTICQGFWLLLDVNDEFRSMMLTFARLMANIMNDQSMN